jgi:hypothetical protein
MCTTTCRRMISSHSSTLLGQRPSERIPATRTVGGLLRMVSRSTSKMATMLVGDAGTSWRICSGSTCGGEWRRRPQGCQRSSSLVNVRVQTCICGSKGCYTASSSAEAQGTARLTTSKEDDLYLTVSDIPMKCDFAVVNDDGSCYYGLGLMMEMRPLKD